MSSSHLTAMSTIGMNLRVTTDSKQGGRKYMEDVLDVQFYKGEDGKEIEFAYFAVFDGHGGPEAALFAKQHLLKEIIKHKGFWGDDDTQVMRSIKAGFVSCHRLMWKAVAKWPRTVSGLPSTAGTTASVVFIRKGKMYIAHVGDSSIVLGVKQKGHDALKAHLITVDHKPESPKEKRRIEDNGGSVVARAGVQRVVWNRPKPYHKGPIRRSTVIDHIPFLAVARALGDLWSYNCQRDTFIVSPEPDVCTYKLDPAKHKCLVIASDGLWNMVRPQEAVALVEKVDHMSAESAGDPKPSVELVETALNRWHFRLMRADNTSVIVVLFDPPGQSRSPLQSHSSISSGSTLKISDSDDSLSESEHEDAPIDFDEEEDLGVESLPMLSPFNAPNLPKPITNHRVISKRALVRPIFKGRPAAPKSAPPKLAVSRAHQVWPTAVLNRSKSVPQGNPEQKPQGAALSAADKQNSASRTLLGKANSLLGKLYTDVLGTVSSAKTQFNIEQTGQGNASTGGCSNVASPSTQGQKDKEATSPRTLRSHSPRLVGCNLTNSDASPQSKDCGIAAHVTSCRASLDFRSPKEATSAKSPLKVDVGKGASPSAGLVSPIWPSSLDVGMEVEIDTGSLAAGKLTCIKAKDQQLVDGSLQEICENTVSPCVNTPTKLAAKRKSSSPCCPNMAAKRAKSPAVSHSAKRTPSKQKTSSKTHQQSKTRH